MHICSAEWWQLCVMDCCMVRMILQGSPRTFYSFHLDRFPAHSPLDRAGGWHALIWQSWAEHVCIHGIRFDRTVNTTGVPRSLGLRTSSSWCAHHPNNSKAPGPEHLGFDPIWTTASGSPQVAITSVWRMISPSCYCQEPDSILFTDVCLSDSLCWALSEWAFFKGPYVFFCLMAWCLFCPLFPPSTPCDVFSFPAS